MTKPRALSSDDLKALIQQQIAASSGGDGSAISKERSDLMDRYLQEPYGDEEVDRSQVVSNDVADVVDSIQPDLMEIFCGGDQVVKFDPQGPEDVDAAEQETDVLNYVFYQQMDGFLLMYEWVKDALLQKNGYIKWWWGETVDKRVERYFGVTQEAIDGLEQKIKDGGEEVEIASQTEAEIEQPGEQPQAMPWDAVNSPSPWPEQPQGIPGAEPGTLGQMPPGMMGQMPPPAPPPAEATFDVVFKVESKPRGKPYAAVIPPDEMLVPPRWSSVFLDDAPYVIHKTRRTQSDLISAGYDAEQIDALPTAGDPDDAERASRFAEETSANTRIGARATREIEIAEWYGRADRDGDGIAELRKVTVSATGGDILIWGDDPPDGRKAGDEDDEEVEEVPIAVLTPIIMPHRHFGRCPADIAKPFARIRTVVRRQLLDNVYQNNFPRIEIAETGVGNDTIDDLLNPGQGRLVRTLIPGTLNVIRPPVMTAESLQADEAVRGDLENSTGVTRYNQGLDSESLNKTATGISRIMSAAQRKVQLIARTFAETGVKRLFLGLHGLLQRHSSKPLTIRLRNTWVPVDPREWKKRYDLSISVGLGTGNKDQELMHLQTVWQGQQVLMQHPNPAFAGMVTPKNVFSTAEKICEKAGLKTAAPYFTDPDELAQQQAQQSPQPPPPDPAMLQMQAQQQTDQAKLQLEGQKAMAAHELAQQQAADDKELRLIKIRADFILGLENINAQYGTQIDVARLDAEVESGRVQADAVVSTLHKAADLAHQARQAQADRAMQAAQGQQDLAHQATQADAQRQHDAEQADAQRQMDAAAQPAEAAPA